jgi:hypothetical protein
LALSSRAWLAALAMESAVLAALAESDSADDVVAVSLQDVIIAATAKITDILFIFINFGFEIPVQYYCVLIYKTMIFLPAIPTQ